MWVRWSDQASIEIQGATASVEVDGATVVIPGGAAVVDGLRELLRGPMPLAALERELSARNTPGAAEALGELVNAQALTPWELAPDLIGLHQQTVAGGEGPALSPAHETGRILREMSGGKSIPLPYSDDHGSLRQALESRRSCRRFRARTLPGETLGRVLGLAASVAGEAPPAPKAPGGPPARRPYPSGGGLYPVELLVYSSDVREIRPGFYYYQSLSHRLVPFAPRPENGFKTLVGDHPVLEAAFFVIFFLDFARLSLSKYGRKAYRLALLEAGHVAQNVLLASSACHLETLALCGFDDERLTIAAGLRYPEQAVIYMLAVGSAGEDTDE